MPEEKNLEIIETQCSIISMQSNIINELFSLLMQHISVQEADELPVIAKINEAARLRETLEREL